MIEATVKGPKPFLNWIVTKLPAPGKKATGEKNLEWGGKNVL